jgi:hypothetical protein
MNDIGLSLISDSCIGLTRTESRKGQEEQSKQIKVGRRRQAEQKNQKLCYVKHCQNWIYPDLLLWDTLFIESVGYEENTVFQIRAVGLASQSDSLLRSEIKIRFMGSGMHFRVRYHDLAYPAPCFGSLSRIRLITARAGYLAWGYTTGYDPLQRNPRQNQIHGTVEPKYVPWWYIVESDSLQWGQLHVEKNSLLWEHTEGSDSLLRNKP